jgi:Ca2+-binding EF-hand superfamily protein
MFAKADANRDGFVTREEADAAHKTMAGDWREKRAKRMAERGDARFDKLDANKDGQISKQEYTTAQTQFAERRAGMKAGGKMRMHRAGMGMHGRMFDMADANKDGRVSLQEMQTLALQHFDSADANRDGTVTPEERKQMHQRMKAERQRPA